MRRTRKFASLISLPALGLLVIAGAFLTQCKKFDLERKMMLSTDNVKEITRYTADVTGTILDLAEIEGKYYGFHWAVAGEQVHRSDTIILGKPTYTGQFTETLENLESGTDYEVWTYVHDGVKEISSDPVPFSTLPPDPPVVETYYAKSSNPGTIWCIYEVSENDEGSAVAEHGVYWGTQDPQTKVVLGQGCGVFECLIEKPNTQTSYFIKPYAISKGAIAYGGLWKVLPPEDLTRPIILTHPATEITSSSALLKATLTYKGQVPITSKGIIWGTEALTDYSDNVLYWESQDSSIVFHVTGLEPDCLYYFRSFLGWNNGTGTTTSGGIELNFRTLME